MLEKGDNLGSNSAAVLSYAPYFQTGNRLLYTSYKTQMARHGRSSHISSLYLRSFHDHPSARRSQHRDQQKHHLGNECAGVGPLPAFLRERNIRSETCSYRRHCRCARRACTWCSSSLSGLPAPVTKAGAPLLWSSSRSRSVTVMLEPSNSCSSLLEIFRYRPLGRQRQRKCY